eukprot:scaffold160910_cov25-Tisochrysis_lutea.AAC.1
MGSSGVRHLPLAARFSPSSCACAARWLDSLISVLGLFGSVELVRCRYIGCVLELSSHLRWPTTR